MVLFGTRDDQRIQKPRTFLLAAFAFLLLIWTIKLSFPQHTILSIYTTHHSPPTPPSKTASSAKPAKTSKTKPENSIVATNTPFLGDNSAKAAVIIETRFRSNLIPLILHFSSVLGPTWPLLIYTSLESAPLFQSSASLARYIHLGQIQIRILPSTILFTNSDSVNAFMTKKWIWESLAPAEHVLVFQSDSMLCANAVRSVDDFFEWDFVGAPIKEGLGRGYNGGLSLRRRSSILRILGRWDWETTKAKGDRFEDQWFFNRLNELQAEEKQQGIEPDEEGAINLPSMEIARTFAVETIDYPHPLGVHQVNRWLKEEEHMLSLDEWCPEWKLCSKEHIEDTPS